jgi:hypothetical protein
MSTLTLRNKPAPRLSLMFYKIKNVRMLSGDFRLFYFVQLTIGNH